MRADPSGGLLRQVRFHPCQSADGCRENKRHFRADPKQIQQLMRRVDGLSNLHVVSLNENVLFDHGFEKIKLKRVILT